MCVSHFNSILQARQAPQASSGTTRACMLPQLACACVLSRHRQDRFGTVTCQPVQCTPTSQSSARARFACRAWRSCLQGGQVQRRSLNRPALPRHVWRGSVRDSLCWAQGGVLRGAAVWAVQHQGQVAVPRLLKQTLQPGYNLTMDRRTATRLQRVSGQLNCSSWLCLAVGLAVGLHLA